MKRKRKKIDEYFKIIKSEYFPRWDKKGEWNIAEDGYMHYQGLCDPEKKTITVNPNLNKDKSLSQLLVHEICHAVSVVGHGKVWQRRMIKASELAKQKGNYVLAELLIQDVEGYKKAKNPYKEIYDKIEDWVFEDPELTYDQIMSGLVRAFGGERQDYEKRYKRCKQVYEKAKKESSLELELRSKWEKTQQRKED